MIGPRPNAQHGVIALEPDAALAREPRPVLVLVVFTVLAVGLTFPSVTRFHSDIAGNSGDAFFNLWVMRSVQHAIPHGWLALWNQPIYHPAVSTLAYSDTLLPVALLHWTLRGVLGDATAFNLIYLGSWVLSSWCMYRLAFRFVSYSGAAMVAALVYTYASIRLAQQQHYQLVLGGALVPLALLLLFRLFERPTPFRGAALGAVVVVLTLTASYYAPLTVLIVMIVAIGWPIVHRPASWRALVVSFAIAGLIVGVIAAPFALKYLLLQRDPYFRRPFQPYRATHLGDLLAGGDRNYLLSHLPLLSKLARPSRDVEHRMFPGFVALAFGGIGIVSTFRLFRRCGLRAGKIWGLGLLGITGLAALIFSFGDWFVVGGQRIALPFSFLRHHVPGFAGVRAVSRLALPAQLALALFAAVGIQALFRRISPRWRLPATVGLTFLVIAESAMPMQFARPPTARDDGGVEQALRQEPTGVVLELPIASSHQSAWVYNQPSWQLLSLHDSDPRVNGYSGFEPPGFPTRVATLNSFPSQRALHEALQLGVRYVVLRTQLVGDIKPVGIGEQLERDGVGRYNDATARRLISQLPPGSTSGIDKLPGAYLVVLK